MSQAPYSRAACALVVDTENVVALSRLPRRAAPAAIVSRPGLWKRLDAAARVTMVPVPPGSGKTSLLRSWIGATGLAERVAWVTVGSDERDRPGLWPSVLSALHQTVPESELVRPLTAAGWRPRMVLLDRNAQERPRPPLDPLDPLSKSEIRVLKYLPTHLSAPEIAGELSLSTSTVKTRIRNLYGKLGAHSRARAVQSGRVLGLLAPPARQR